MYDLNNNLINTFKSATDAALELFNDISKRSGISHCANNKTKSSYGYIWKFI